MKDWSRNTGFGCVKARQLYADTHPASASPIEARQMTIHPSSCRCPRPAVSTLPTASTDCTAHRTGSASWSGRGRTRWRGHEFWSGNPRWPAHCSRTRRRGWFSANSKRPSEKKWKKGKNTSQKLFRDIRKIFLTNPEATWAAIFIMAAAVRFCKNPVPGTPKLPLGAKDETPWMFNFTILCSR